MRILKALVAMAVAALFITAGPALAQQTSTVDQSGDDNEAFIDQLPGDGSSEALIHQSGDRNYADQTQDSWGSDHIRAEINQSGNSNDAVQNQGHFGGISFSGPVQKAEIDQSGNGNYGEQNQSGSGQFMKARLKQSGNLNWSEQHQSGFAPVPSAAAGLFSDVTQSGNGNLAVVTQSTP